MKTATRVALILAGPALLLGVGLYRDSLQHRMPKDDGHRIALVLPKPLPECWQLDMNAAEYRWAAASARLNGYHAEAAMWASIAAEEEARPCKGERWEREE